MNLSKLCLEIFFFRIIDVTLATFSTILTIKNKRIASTIIGFINALIWFFIVKEAINTRITSLWIAFSYAGGYAFGIFIGTTLSNKLINSLLLVQVILDNKNIKNVDIIRNNGFAVSQVDCVGKNNSKKIMLYIELEKRKLNKLKSIISKIDDKAFMIINDTRYVTNGFFN